MSVTNATVAAGDRGSSIKKDMTASLVVFLVAVPLSLGIALASGAPLMAGLIAAAVGGVVVGLCGGAPMQVSGAAAGLSVMTFGMVQQFGWAATCAVTVAAGLIQIALGLFKTGRITLAISPAVVHGMLAGIGVLIVLGQVHVVLGGTPQHSAVKNLQALPQQIADLHGPTVGLGMLTIALLLAMPYAPKPLRKLPGALVAVTVTTLTAMLLHIETARVNLPTDLTSAFSLPHFPTANFGAYIVAALTVALVASTESLLSAVAADKLHNGPRANLDRELVGQGMGNLVSGLIGGLPVTGVIVRSSANIGAGAQTRLSAILHGVWVIVFVALLGGMLRQIPQAALAGLLVVIGAKLVNFHHVRQLVSHREAAVYFVTLLGVVGFSLLTGVGLGIAVAVGMLLRRLSHSKIVTEERKGRWHVRVEGKLTFMTTPKLTEALGKIPAGADVDVDLMADFMDHAAFEALHNWRVQQEKSGGHVDIDEKHERWYEQRETMSARADLVRAEA
jgi:carbonic anhydrase